MAALFAFLVLGERPGLLALVGIALASAGVLLLSTGGGTAQVEPLPHRSLGIALVAFSPVGRGALAADIDVAALTDQDLRRRMPRFAGEDWQHNRTVLRAFATLAGEAGLRPAQLALGWVLAQGDHVHAIPGTRSMAHFDVNDAAGRLELSPAILARADALVNRQSIRGHRYPPAILATIDTEDYAL